MKGGARRQRLLAAFLRLDLMYGLIGRFLDSLWLTARPAITKLVSANGISIKTAINTAVRSSLGLCCVRISNQASSIRILPKTLADMATHRDCRYER